MSEFLDQDIKFLPGVGPKRAELLNKELNVKTFRDLIYYFPYKYIDRTKFYKISEIHAQMPYIQIKGEIRSMETVGQGNKERLSARFYDNSGSIELVWFRAIKWQKENLKLNKEYIVFGKPGEFNGKLNVVHPDMETEEEKQLKPAGLFQGYYITTEKMKSKFINSKIINKLQLTLIQLAKGKIRETLPAALTKKLRLYPLEDALTTIQPLTFNVTYLYVRADSATQTDAESRWGLTLMDGEKALGDAEVSLQSGVTSLRSSLLGDSWVAFGGEEEALSAEGAIGQATESLTSQSIAPGLLSFATGVLAHTHDVDFTKWDSVLETYTTKIDLWIEAYREGAKLGKAEDGTTTMEVNYTIPASAFKAQLKQMVMDMLADQDLLSRLSTLIGTEAAQQYLNPELQSYYFYAIDELPVSKEMTISRTVSLKGDTLALSLTRQ
ncbi:MAG: hypothetical protein EOM73_06860 [Bacteroidia bacterium]|nr:hypothetical protein [Bacteroidia bacterium]